MGPAFDHVGVCRGETIVACCQSCQTEYYFWAKIYQRQMNHMDVHVSTTATPKRNVAASNMDQHS